MFNRRNFIKTSTLGFGSLSLSGLAAPSTGGAPKRFIFIRKSNGIRPNEVALPTFTEEQKNLDKRREAFEVNLDQHELPSWLNPIAKHKANLSILQGLSCKMSENGHWSYSSVMGAFKSGRNSLSGIKRA
ncbi:DUF1552 domain-containing protein, partial [Akkermansiaceae bacterium]|nr:DUF1552 domain-containing protein [Akkermansiaceae bacterium]